MYGLREHREGRADRGQDDGRSRGPPGRARRREEDLGMAVSTMIGAKIHRREDPRLISGHGRFIDDMTRPGMAHMAVVRSPHPHAKIRSIDPAESKKAPGVT